MAENLGYSAIKFTLYGKKLTKINKEVLTILPPRQRLHNGDVCLGASSLGDIGSKKIRSGA